MSTSKSFKIEIGEFDALLGRRHIRPDVKARPGTNPYGISRVAAGEAKDAGGLKIFSLFSIKA